MRNKTIGKKISEKTRQKPINPMENPITQKPRDLPGP
jgi:hypothetical protein